MRLQRREERCDVSGTEKICALVFRERNSELEERERERKDENNHALENVRQIQ